MFAIPTIIPNTRPTTKDYLYFTDLDLEMLPFHVRSSVRDNGRSIKTDAIITICITRVCRFCVRDARSFLKTSQKAEYEKNTADTDVY